MSRLWLISPGHQVFTVFQYEAWPNADTITPIVRISIIYSWVDFHLQQEHPAQGRLLHLPVAHAFNPHEMQTSAP